MDGIRLQVEAHYSDANEYITKTGGGGWQSKGLQSITITIKTDTYRHWRWKFAKEITGELSPTSFNDKTMHLSNNKSVDEVENILKKYGFLKVSTNTSKTAPEIVIEMYRP